MERYTVHDGRLWFGARNLCADDQVLADTQELLHCIPTDGVVHMRTPARVDIVFTSGPRKRPPTIVVGGESKQYADLVSSFHTRRLARQLKTLRAVVDVPVLFLRLPCPVDFPDPDTLQAIIGLERHGVLVLPLPTASLPARLWLASYRDGFAGDGWQALAGYDRPPQDRQPGWLLRRIPGIGRIHSGKLVATFGTTEAVFAAARAGAVRPHLGPAIEQKLLKALGE